MKTFTIFVAVLGVALAGTHAAPQAAPRDPRPPAQRTRLSPPSAAARRLPPPSPAVRRPPGSRRHPPPPTPASLLLDVTVHAQVSSSVYRDDTLGEAGAGRPPGTVLRLVPLTLSGDPNDTASGSANLRVWLPEEVSGGQPALLTGDVVEIVLDMNIPGEAAQQLGQLNATSLPGAVNFQDLWAALTKASAGKGEPLLPPLVLGGQEVPQIPAVKSFRVIYGGNAKGGCKCMVLLPGRRSLNVSSLTFLFNAPSCGYNATSAGAGKGPVLMSAVAHYFETCSYGHMSLPPDRNLVLGPIDLTDCSGVGPTMGRYALDGPVPVLRDGELYGLWDLAKEWMRKNRPDLFAERLRFDRKTLMFPLAAGVASLSNMGCPSNSDATGIIPDCLNWVSPAALSSPSPGVADAAALIRSHLLNNGLASPAASRAACGDAGGSDRSSCRTEPYGDPSDPMGTAEPVNAAGGVVCPAAPQSYTSGWAKAMLPLKGTPAAGEGFVPYEVPSMHTAETNFLRIAISQTGVRWAGSRRKQERAVFVSYRVASPTPGGYDTGLPASLSGRVWVHEYNQTADGLPLDPNMPPVLLAMLEAAGPTLALPDAFGAGDALHIRFVSKSNTTATVELCRNTLAVENVEDGTCFDALDNDCDGLTDFDDPDCQ